jgi:hypothetical protein
MVEEDRKQENCFFYEQVGYHYQYKGPWFMVEYGFFLFYSTLLYSAWVKRIEEDRRG